MAERLRDRVYLAHAFHDVALNSLNRADFGRSKEYFHRFLELVPDAFGATDMRLMAVAYELDDFEEAHRYVNRIVADFGDEKPGPWPMGSLGAYSLRADDPWLLEITVTLSKRGYEMNSKSPEIHDAVRRAELESLWHPRTKKTRRNCTDLSPGSFATISSVAKPRPFSRIRAVSQTKRSKYTVPTSRVWIDRGGLYLRTGICSGVLKRISSGARRATLNELPGC